MDAVGTVNDQLQRVGLDRLLIKVPRSQTNGPHCIVRVLVSGDDDDLCMRCQFQNLLQRSHALFYTLGNYLPDPLTPLPSRHDAENPRLLYVMLLLGMAAGVYAQDVKYCRDARTGEIITVEAGQPCPFPTHEL